jgi:hypothetical protein
MFLPVVEFSEGLNSITPVIVNSYESSPPIFFPKVKGKMRHRADFSGFIFSMSYAKT